MSSGEFNNNKFQNTMKFVISLNSFSQMLANVQYSMGPSTNVDLEYLCRCVLL